MNRTFACLLASFLGLLAGCGGGTTESRAVIALLRIDSDARSPLIHELHGGVPGLVQFDLAFLNGDHHASDIAVGGVPWFSTGPDLDAFLLKFSDDDSAINDPPDRVAMSATYLNLQDVSPRYVAHGLDLQDVAWLPLEAEIGRDEIFVLSGFEFQTDGSNHHIRVLRITPFPALGYIEVEYRDDSPIDDHYEATVLYAVVPAGPPSEPGSRPAFEGPYEEPFSFQGEGVRDRRPGFAVLHGFSLAFREGDRHLESIGVDLDAPVPLFAKFADGDVGAEDLVDARVSYVLVTP